MLFSLSKTCRCEVPLTNLVVLATKNQIANKRPHCGPLPLTSVCFYVKFDNRQEASPQPSAIDK